MAFWPFSRAAKPVVYSAQELQLKLVEVATTQSPQKLKKFCEVNQAQITTHAGEMNVLPIAIRSNPTQSQRFVQGLGTAAQCMAEQLGDDTLWNVLVGNVASNPMLRADAFVEQISERMDRLEYDGLISECRTLIEEFARLEGGEVRQYRALLHGRLGELLFHSGKVDDSEGEMRQALLLCREIGDDIGVRTYLNNLIEVARYQGKRDSALQLAELWYQELHRQGAIDLLPIAQRHVRVLRQGEPACRIVCRHERQLLELSEIHPSAGNKYEFEFARNRPSLRRATQLTEQGMKLAADGKLSEAHELFLSAMEVDPHDPNPLYQDGMALLEMGLYGAARDAFEKVEELAPGWFRCRADRWLSGQLETGALCPQAFRIIRILDDGGLDPATAAKIAKEAVGQFPECATIWLHLGEALINKDKDTALLAFRSGLKHAEEPDVESRLLCALAGLLPADSGERRQLVEKAVSIEGSLVAQAVAHILKITAPHHAEPACEN
jgi:tetratricopeptide (TPR) repeat protein